MNSTDFPKFDEFLSPILNYCKDKQEHTLSETIDKMATFFRMSDDQKNALLPSGKRTYIYDRVEWAITYLVQAGLLERTGRSKFKISELSFFFFFGCRNSLNFTKDGNFCRYEYSIFSGITESSFNPNSDILNFDLPVLSKSPA